jgi:fucose permease
MSKQKQGFLLIFITYGTMLAFGLIENIRGVSYPLIKTEFAASYEQQGLMVSVLSASYVSFCLIAGLILSRFGVKRVFITGFIVSILGAASIFFMPSFWTVAASLVLMFAAFGLFEIGINALATQIFTAKAGLLMNLLHFFYGLGAIIGPKAAGFLISGAGFSWRQVYLLTIPLALLLFLPSVVTRFPAMPGSGKKDAAASIEKPFGFKDALKTPMVWFFALVLGLMVTVEMTPSNWGGLYFQDVYGLDPKTAGAAFVSNFFILFTVSRIVGGFLVEKIGYMRSLIGAVAALLFIFILGFCLGPRGILVLPAMGFFVALMWPTFMAVAIGFFGPRAPMATAVMIAISGTLNAVLQYCVGLINRGLGSAWGFRSCVLYAAVLMVMLVVLARRIREQVAGSK